MVLVIGESARKANFQLYGYQRDTNPLLKRRADLKVFEATSCATYTTAGTKAILESVNSDDLHEQFPGENIYYDAILMKGLRQRIEMSLKHKVLIVLHTSTSHGPKYADKYPKAFEVLNLLSIQSPAYNPDYDIFR